MFIKTILIPVSLFFYCGIALGQLQTISARDQAMGNSSVACISDNFIPVNIAATSEIKNTSLNFSVANKYFIKELSPVFLSIVKPFKNDFSVLAGLGRIGNSQYSEQLYEGGIVKKLAQKFSAGIKIQFHQWIISESQYKSSRCFIPEASLFANPLKNIFFGVIIRNPVRVRMNTIEKNKLPAVINTGLSVKVSDKLLFACSAIQQSDETLSFQTGVEYSFHPRFLLRTGFHTLPLCESFGISLKLSKVFIELSLQTHPVLGNSSTIALTMPL